MNEEHKKLYDICQKIGYKIVLKDSVVYYDDSGLTKGTEGDNGWAYVDVREIIFTPEFNNKMLDYLESKKSIETKITYALGLMNNLYNPVEYLYNL